MRYESREALLADVRKEHRLLRGVLEGIPRSRWREPGVWGDAWSIHDLLAHLAAWHDLFLGWFREGEAGGRPELPAPGYGWRETPRLNRAIQEEHAGRSLADVEADFARSHAEVLALLEGLSEEQVMEPGRYAWTGKNALVTYAGANTASHYRFARKVLRRWLRDQPEGAGGAPGA